MVIDDFDLFGIPILPNEAQTPLPIDPDRPLPFAISPQLFQAIAWRRAQVFDLHRAIERYEGSSARSAIAAKRMERLVRHSRSVSLSAKPMIMYYVLRNTSRLTTISRGAR
jgi:hypothetical protein